MSGHLPVMLSEVIQALNPRNGANYIDGTFGGGGYTRAILEAADCRVLGIDRDPDAIARGQALVQHFAGRLTLEAHKLSVQSGEYPWSFADGLELGAVPARAWCSEGASTVPVRLLVVLADGLWNGEGIRLEALNDREATWEVDEDYEVTLPRGVAEWLRSCLAGGLDSLLESGAVTDQALMSAIREAVALLQAPESQEVPPNLPQLQAPRLSEADIAEAAVRLTALDSKSFPPKRAEALCRDKARQDPAINSVDDLLRAVLPSS